MAKDNCFIVNVKTGEKRTEIIEGVSTGIQGNTTQKITDMNKVIQMLIAKGYLTQAETETTISQAAP